MCVRGGADREGVLGGAFEEVGVCLGASGWKREGKLRVDFVGGGVGSGRFRGGVGMYRGGMGRCARSGSVR